MTKPLVIYHADCTDGFGAAFAAWLKFGDEAEYLPMQYGSKAQLDMIAMRSSFETRDIYILDFSFSREAMDQIFSCAKRVVWLDHHKSALEMWGVPEGQRVYVEGDKHWHDESDHYVKLHNDKSGALLAWEFFHPGTEVPMLLRHIDDRDRWQFKLEGSKELHAALASYKPWSFELWYAMFKMNTLWPFYMAGHILLRAQDAAVADMLKQARKCEVRWCEDTIIPRRSLGLACNSQLHISELGHELANSSGTYGLVYYIGADGSVKCSLRSNGDYDVSAIAKAFGGGGHRNAAGFQTDIETLMGWLA